MRHSRFVDRRVREPRSATGEILTEDAFHRMLQLEQNRSRRTQRPFALLTIETGRSRRAGNDFDLLPSILSIVHDATRESDLAGWVETGASVGVMLNEVQPEKELGALQGRIVSALKKSLTADQLAGIRFRCAMLPEELTGNDASRERAEPAPPWQPGASVRPSWRFTRSKDRRLPAVATT